MLPIWSLMNSRVTVSTPSLRRRWCSTFLASCIPFYSEVEPIWADLNGSMDRLPDLPDITTRIRRTVQTPIFLPCMVSPSSKSSRTIPRRRPSTLEASKVKPPTIHGHGVRHDGQGWQCQNFAALQRYQCPHAQVHL